MLRAGGCKYLADHWKRAWQPGHPARTHPPTSRTPSPSKPHPHCHTHPDSPSLRSLLDKIGESDMNQIKLVFDSIDKNRDGQLSLAELEQFAANLG